VTIHLRNLEWGDHNSERSFPLTVDATQADLSGTFVLPDDFIVDIRLAVSAGSNWLPNRFYVKNIGNYATGFGIVIGYDNSSSQLTVATANIARGAFVEYEYYQLTGVGDFVDSAGFVQLGKLAGMDNQPGGQFEFDRVGGQLETDCIQPQIRTLSSLTLINGSDVSDKIYGDIELIAGRNMRITAVSVGDVTQIVFDAIEGEGLTEDCVCDGEEDTVPIRTINGIPPTADGDFTILGNSCLIPEAITNGLRLNDACSEPCCGCTELEIVTAQLEQFGRQATTLENFLVNLEARVTQMDQVVLGSRLGDRGCETCE
jgi:hypothetical protein